MDRILALGGNLKNLSLDISPDEQYAIFRKLSRTNDSTTLYKQREKMFVSAAEQFGDSLKNQQVTIFGFFTDDEIVYGKIREIIFKNHWFGGPTTVGVNVSYCNQGSQIVLTRTVSLGLVMLGKFHLPQPPTVKEKKMVKAWLAQQETIWQRVLGIMVLNRVLDADGGLIRDIIENYF